MVVEQHDIKWRGTGRERPKRRFGIAKHWKIPSDDVLLEPMSEEDLRWAEGYYQTKDGFYTRATLRKPGREKTSRRKRKA
jgi:hypothetical protein